MKKALWFIGAVIVLGCVGQYLTVSASGSPYYPVQGGTGTAAIPSVGMVLIGNSSGTYTPAYLQCSSGCSVATSSGGVAITVPTASGTSIFAGPYILVTASGTNGYVVQNIGVLSLASSSDIGVSNATGTGITFSFLNPKGYATTTIQSVLNSLSAIGLASYNSSTGQFSVSSSSLHLGTASQYSFSDFLPSSTVYVANTNGNWAGTWQLYNPSDFLSSSTVYISTTTGNWQGTWKTYNPSDFLTSSTIYLSTTTGNWIGTWQGANSSTFYLASNPNHYVATSSLGTAALYNYTDFLPSSTIYIATNTGNWAGTWQNATSGTYYPYSNPLGFVTSTSGGGLTGNSTSSWIAVYNSSGTLTGYASGTYNSSTDLWTLSNLTVNSLTDAGGTSTKCLAGILDPTTCVNTLNGLFGNVIATGTANEIQVASGTGSLVFSFPVVPLPASVGGTATTTALGSNAFTSTVIPTSSISSYARSTTKTVCASDALDTKNCDYFATATSSDVAVRAAYEAVGAAGGGTVQLSQGYFNYDAPVQMDRTGVTIQGAGIGATIYAQDTDVNKPAFEFLPTSTATVYFNAINDIQIVGNDTYADNTSTVIGEGNGIYIDSVSTSTFWDFTSRNTFVETYAGDNFYSNEGHGYVLDRFISENSGGDGVHFAAGCTTQPNILNGTIKNNASSGVEMDCNEGFVENNEINDNGTYGVEATGYSDTIQSNVLLSNGLDGVYLNGADGDKVFGNTFGGNNENGVNVQSGDALVQGNYFDADSAIASNTYSEVNVNGAANIINENVISGGYGGTSPEALYGINISSGSASTTVMGNQITNVSSSVNNASASTLSQVFGTLTVNGLPVLTNAALASSSLTMNIYDATTTVPYAYAEWTPNKAITVSSVSCNEYSGTTTIELYQATAQGSVSKGSDLVSSIACGAATSTTSITTSTVSANIPIIAKVTGIAGTPSWTIFNIFYKTN